MSGALFGVAGNSRRFTETVSKASADAPAWLAALGLDCYEYQCGKGVHVGRETAQTIGKNAAAHGILLSLHAPYFINPANPEPESTQKSIAYAAAACQAAQWMGADRVIIHTGALMKRGRREALEIAKKSFAYMRAACDELGYAQIALCPETMGKVNQLGDLEEVLELCRLDERHIPCIDFGHLYARTMGVLDGYDACAGMLDQVEQALGSDRAGAFHSHFSHIEFTPNGGEKCHRTFCDDGGYGPAWTPLAFEIARRGWSPRFICESAGTQSEDALEMQSVYRDLQAQAQ